jgi:tryptophan-rich hypothetical protein
VTLQIATQAVGRNPINRKNVVGSKWTATRPGDRQKHFIVLDWVRDKDGVPTEMVEVEAILTRNVSTVHWRELKDHSVWRIGWR